ncbi:hypothetical protein [Streptomyces melanosporofaciens]|uniref:Uncharacterized protein n=1 Tax=Streptomyces melanosporofaciens TaxID=67327 RepID=A0A1H4U4K2_STRMJ|nr:hypothetical protein [Streptomyces melanosporofaciens]SEC63161.1 hypothetical protein SAMN04490356_4893 [Streptomyces melanosporofaciens]
MDWDTVTLLVLAAFGLAGLILTMAAELLSKVPAVIEAWRRVRATWRGGQDG